MKINEMIRDKRKEKSLTQQELADILFISSKTISRWETGNAVPELSMLLKLSEILEINFDSILASVKSNHHSTDLSLDLKILNSIIISGVLVTTSVLTSILATIFLSGNNFVVLITLSILLLIVGMLLYFILENNRMSQVGKFSVPRLNFHRNKMFNIWVLTSSGYIISVLIYVIKDQLEIFEIVIVMIISIIAYFILMFLLIKKLLIKD